MKPCGHMVGHVICMFVRCQQTTSRHICYKVKNKKLLFGLKFFKCYFRCNLKIIEHTIKILFHKRKQKYDK